MSVAHRFTPAGDHARNELTITVWGLPGLLWDRLIARPQAKGAESQTRAFLAFAARYACSWRGRPLRPRHP